MSSRYNITPDLQAQLCGMIALGCSLRRASALLGVAESTVRNTMAREPEFAGRIRNAERTRELIPLKNIRQAAEKSWRANAWLLERLNPHDYTRRFPKQMTAEELGEALDQFALTLVNEIPRPEDRKKVLEKLQRLTTALERAPDLWEKEPRPTRPKNEQSWLEELYARVDENTHAEEQNAEESTEHE